MKYHFTAHELANGCRTEPTDYYEFIRRPSLNSGIYMLPAGSKDDQKPHDEDELYYVLQGRSRMLIGGLQIDVSQGDVIYVPAFEDHHFYDIVEDLKLLVFFSGAPVKSSEDV